VSSSIADGLSILRTALARRWLELIFSDAIFYGIIAVPLFFIFITFALFIHKFTFI